MDTKELKILAIPLLFFFSLMTLSVLLVKFGYPKVKLEYDKYKLAQKNEIILLEKEAILKEVADELPTEANFLSTALPDKNPGLLLISQLKNLAQPENFILENIKIGTEINTAQLSSTAVYFSTSGDPSKLLDLIVNTTKISPLFLIKNIKMDKSAGVLSANIIGSTYWSNFPTQLPVLTEPINRYTKTERDLMVKISALTPPMFSEVTPIEVPQKADPFAF